MKNILVPIDFSIVSEHATRLAMELAKRHEATLYLLHIMEYNSVGPLEPDGTYVATTYTKAAVERTLREGELKLDNYFIKLNIHQPHIKKLYGLGALEGVISDKIEELDIDLVVMGTQGTSGIKELFFDSNAEKVVRHVKCPVITIKKETKIEDIKSIVFGTDLIYSSQHVISKLNELQSWFDAHLYIVRVNTPDNFERDEVIKEVEKKIAAKLNSENVTIKNYNDVTPEKGIRHFAEEHNADMIALGTHGLKGLSHFFSGSIAEDIINHSSKAVWTSHL